MPIAAVCRIKRLKLIDESEVRTENDQKRSEKEKVKVKKPALCRLTPHTVKMYIPKINRVEIDCCCGAFFIPRVFNYFWLLLLLFRCILNGD